MADRGSVTRWECARCKVIARWARGAERGGQPTTWTEDEGQIYCLACRRALAAEAALDDAPENLTNQRRAQLRAGALVEFEIRRDPQRTNGEIARAIRTSVAAVVKARQRLDAAA